MEYLVLTKEYPIHYTKVEIQVYLVQLVFQYLIQLVF